MSVPGLDLHLETLSGDSSRFLSNKDRDEPTSKRYGPAQTPTRYQGQSVLQACEGP